MYNVPSKGDAIGLVKALHGDALEALGTAKTWEFEVVREAVKPHLNLFSRGAWKKASIVISIKTPRPGGNHC